MKQGSDKKGPYFLISHCVAVHRVGGEHKATEYFRGRLFI